MKDLCHVQLAVSGGHCHLDLTTDCAFLERWAAYDAFKLKMKQSFGKRKIRNNCVMMLEKNYYIQVLQQHSKLLHLLGLEKNQHKFNV